MMRMGVKAALVNNVLSEELSMEQPQGFVVKNREYNVYRLMKAVYGLKQASRAWRKHLNILLKSLECVLSTFDAGMYFKKKNGEM